MLQYLSVLVLRKLRQMNNLFRSVFALYVYFEGTQTMNVEMKVRENAVAYEQMQTTSTINAATNHNNKCDFINKNNDQVQESTIESPNLLERVNNPLKRTINTMGIDTMLFVTNIKV
eukprot:m.251315 g.251315  ORF g.251315 m.251315 type:complete len:117 (-) comp33893_c2_seq10:6-356(-)